MELGASKEDYLKLIYLESEPYGSARVSSVAAELKYSKPTVSATFSKLEALGLIEKTFDRSVIPTEQGAAIAQNLLVKYHFFTGYLRWLGLPKEIAMQDADKMEHAFSNESFLKVVASVAAHQKEIKKLADSCLINKNDSRIVYIYENLPEITDLPKLSVGKKVKKIKKKPQKLQWEPKPENSGAMPMSRDERREDILETIGEWYGKGRSTTIEELSRYFGNTEPEIKRYLAELTVRQQIFPVKGKQDLIQPTQHGIIESQNAMKKHKIMSEFFQLIGVDQEKAEDDACRMEHIVSDDSIMCLNSFLRNDGRYERAITGYNLHSRYAVGTYPGIMGIYQISEETCPRRLAEEFYDYRRDILLNVELGKSHFVLQKKEENETAESAKALWYKKTGNEWGRAQQGEAGECIPAEFFEYVLQPDDPIIEAYILVTFLPADAEECSMEVIDNICELDIEIW